MIYHFWSIYGTHNYRCWYCIPPSEEYVPVWYPKGALIKKHKEKILPPAGCWLEPGYERLVYEQGFIT